MKLYGPNEKIVASTRGLWSEMFYEVAEKDERIVALVGDLSRSTTTEVIRKKAPERFYNVGIAEQNMLGMAAGLALCGKIPYCNTFAPFAAMRAGEQFRTDACYMNLKVRVIAGYAGISQPAGPTHSGLEDAGIIRGMPNATVVEPSDLSSLKKLFEASVDYPGPMYIRLGLGKNEPYLYAEDFDYAIGKAIYMQPGRDVTILASGIMVRKALIVREELAKEGLDVGVVDVHTLKPLDEEMVLRVAGETGRILTWENHSVLNGLGSAVAEVLLENGGVGRFKRFGIPDLYPSYGDPDRLADKYGFGVRAVCETIRNWLR